MKASHSILRVLPAWTCSVWVGLEWHMVVYYCVTQVWWQFFLWIKKTSSNINKQKRTTIWLRFQGQLVEYRFRLFFSFDIFNKWSQWIWQFLFLSMTSSGLDRSFTNTGGASFRWAQWNWRGRERGPWKVVSPMGKVRMEQIGNTRNWLPSTKLT